MVYCINVYKIQMVSENTLFLVQTQCYTQFIELRRPAPPYAALAAPAEPLRLKHWNVNEQTKRKPVKA